MKRKKLVIISHTEHYKDSTGVIKGWGPTINEVNYLADYWEEVVHVGCLHTKKTPPSALPYTQNNISFVPIPPYGGKTLKDKFLILVKIPKIIYQVIKSVRGASEVQLRLPTSMGLFLLPLFSFFISRKFTFWVKYAGNWNQEHPPLSYRLQRWWLKKDFARCKVTINGFWDDQPAHCISFENPCLTQEDISLGKQIAANKTFDGSYIFSFVGRLEDAKGVSRIIEALRAIPADKIKEVHFVGNGNKMEHYKSETSFLGDKVVFHGFLDKKGVHTILANSHFFLLPSTASEGFPKVIAEAGCYGTIPIVSDISSISHYISPTNGFLWSINSSENFNSVLRESINHKNNELKDKSDSLLALAKMFTFDNYKFKLNKYIF